MSLTSPTSTGAASTTKRRRTDSDAVSVDDKYNNTSSSSTSQAPSLPPPSSSVHIPKRGARACTACRKGKNRRISRLESQFLVMQSTMIGMQSSLDRILTAIQIQSPNLSLTNPSSNPSLTLTSSTSSTSTQSFSPDNDEPKKFPPLPGFAPPPHKYATYGILPSTAPSSDDESEDTLPRSTMNAPIEALQGLANAAAEAAAAAAATSAPLPVPPRVKKRRRAEPIPRNAFPSVLEKALTDFLPSQGLVSDAEAQELYHIFFSGCHLFIPLFDPAYDTYEGLKERTPFCFDAILAVASKIRSGNGPPTPTFFKCLEEAQGIARSTLFGPIVRKEAVQAMLLLSAWSTNGWLPCGHAMRMALDLGLHRALDKLADSGNFGNERSDRGERKNSSSGGGGGEDIGKDSGRDGSNGRDMNGDDIDMRETHGTGTSSTDVNLNGSRQRARSTSVSGTVTSRSNGSSTPPPPMNNNDGGGLTIAFSNPTYSKRRTEEEERDLVVSARIWLCLYWFDHQLSLGTGRPIVLRDDNSIKHCRLLLSHPMSSPTDVRLVAQIELIMQKTQIYETLSPLVSDRQTNNNTNAGALVAIIRRAQLALDKWWADWDAFHASQGHPPNSLLRKILSSELYYAKLWLVCVALRGASWDKLPFEQREMAFQAKEAASRCLEVFLGCAEYRAALRYAVHDSLVTAAFSGLFLLKMAHLFPGEVDIGAIATQVEQLAGLLSDVAAERYALTLRLMLVNLRRKMGMSYGQGHSSIPSQNVHPTQMNMNMMGPHVRGGHPHDIMASQSQQQQQQHGMSIGHNGLPGSAANVVVPSHSHPHPHSHPQHPHGVENLVVQYIEPQLNVGMVNIPAGMIQPFSNHHHTHSMQHDSSPQQQQQHTLPPLLNTDDLGFVWPSDADGGIFSPSMIPVWLQEQSLSDLGIPINGVDGIFLNVNGPSGWNGDFVSMPEACLVMRSRNVSRPGVSLYMAHAGLWLTHGFVEDPTHVLLIADPQILDLNSYPSRPRWLQVVTQYIVDLNLRKSWNAVISKLRPDLVIFLGDMMDNGRSVNDDELIHKILRKVQVYIQLLPVRTSPFSDELIKSNARSRYFEAFGPFNQHFQLANHTFLLIDAPALVDEFATANRDKMEWSKVNWGTIGYLQSFYKFRSSEPVILLSHIPLARSNFTAGSCGPHRENIKPITPGYGQSYQNLLPKEVTLYLLNDIRPSIVFSGDDHDYCDYQHVLLDKSKVDEISVRSFSMAMGIKRPGFQLLSIAPLPALHSQNTSTSSSPPGNFAHTPCLLPNQINIYIFQYGLSAILTILVLFIVNYRHRHRHPNSKPRRRIFREASHDDDDDEASISISGSLSRGLKQRSNSWTDDDGIDMDPLRAPILSSSSSSPEISSRPHLTLPLHFTNTSTSLHHTYEPSPVQKTRRKIHRWYIKTLWDFIHIAWPPLLLYTLISYWYFI
ncbi:hypothetical protein Clacol_000855 [Clathrus columnatus]|uniref:Xylanolytic transcriptional activator regulatory domain-containing protein n=1 Tax=Clathrus columnatus TaxID=1419009 RepID=A0AAV4ZXX1_9AGAM|nr:hypothetical protein Clacol_000855 [Clathrus columnatus]